MNLIFFHFYRCAFSAIAKNSLPNPKSEKVFLGFLLEVHSFSAYIYSGLVNFSV